MNHPVLSCSVALCTFNGEAYLEKQLDSFASQTRPPDELIVFDDGSDDATLNILRTFAEQNKKNISTRIIQNEKTLGVTANFEQAIRACTGDVVFLSDQDDRWHREKIARFMEEFERSSSCTMVFCDAAVIDQYGSELGYRFLSTMLSDNTSDSTWLEALFERCLIHNRVAGMCMAFRQSHVPHLLPISPHGFHDAWITLLTAAADQCVFIDDALVDYRLHQGQKVGLFQNGIQKIRHALTMDEDYFFRQYAFYRDALSNLKALEPGRVSDARISMLTRKVEHAKQRWQIRTQGGRFKHVVKSAMSKAYHRFDYGWPSAIQDLLR